MKTNKKGKVVLQRGDYRVANFIFHEENNFIKVMALSGIVSWRVSLDTSAASTFSQLCVVPDPAFFAKHAELINAQTEAHPEYYGKPQPTDDKEADDKILQEEREFHEAVEQTAKD